MATRHQPLPAPRVMISALVTIALCAAAAFADVAEAERAFRRAQQALDRDNLDAALGHLNEALRLNPRLAEAYSVRGWIHAEQGRLDRAVADYDEALRLEPEDAETLCNRGDALAKQGRTDRALADLAKAIRCDPKLIEARLVRAYVHAECGRHESAVADATEALRLEPRNVQALLQRAGYYSALKRFAEAAADLDAAARIEPENVHALAARAVARLHQGHYRPGIADLRAAIGLNPHDAGQTYEPWAKTPPSPAALRHGEEQLRRILAERPAMAANVKPDDVLWRWAVRRLAGEGLATPVDWDPTPPEHSEAEHTAPVDGRNARVRISSVWLTGPHQGKPRDFEQLWSNLAFELHNLAYVGQFIRLHREAERGKLQKRQFIGEMLKYEYHAAQQTRAFYVEVYLPWAEQKRLTTDPAPWFLDWWDDAEEALDSFPDQSGYPWRPYARQYDWATVRRLCRAHDYAPAAKLLETMAAEKDYDEERSHALMWLGRCRIEIDRPQDAIGVLDEAIRLEPDNAEAYRLRGIAHQELGHQAQAEADFAKARRDEDDGESQP